MKEYLEPFKDYITVKNIVFFILILLFIKFLSNITMIAMLFFAGYVLAASLNPLVDKLAERINRSLAATIILTASIIVVVAIFVPLLYIVAVEIDGLVQYVPSQIAKITKLITTNDIFGHKLTDFINVDSVFSSSQQVLHALWSKSVNITMNFLQGVLCFLVICMVIYYFTADKEVIEKGVLKLFPANMKDKACDIYESISKNVGGYVIAQILSMVAVGAMTAAGLFLLGVRYSVFLGVFTGVLDIIPFLGPTIALCLCLITAYPLGLIKMALVIVIFLAAQQISNNLVRPVIFGKFLNLHPLIIIMALLISGQFLGLWGVLLAPAIASLVWVLFDELYIKMINKTEEPAEEEN